MKEIQWTVDYSLISRNSRGFESDIISPFRLVLTIRLLVRSRNLAEHAFRSVPNQHLFVSTPQIQ